MLLEHEGRKYEILTASSIGYGMGVEMSDVTGKPQEDVLFAFQFDVDGRIEFSCYRDNIPFGLVEVFMREVRKRLIFEEPFTV